MTNNLTFGTFSACYCQRGFLRHLLIPVSDSSDYTLGRSHPNAATDHLTQTASGIVSYRGEHLFAWRQPYKDMHMSIERVIVIALLVLLFLFVASRVL